LGIQVNKQSSALGKGQTGGEIDRGCRLADTALLIRNSYDFGQ